MYGVINIIKFPDFEDPRMLSLELFPTFVEAEKRTREIVEKFIEEYGEDYVEYATEKRPVAIMFNGDVIAYAFIEKVKE